jgi:hypothetical protein
MNLFRVLLFPGGGGCPTSPTVFHVTVLGLVGSKLGCAIQDSKTHHGRYPRVSLGEKVHLRSLILSSSFKIVTESEYQI